MANNLFNKAKKVETKKKGTTHETIEVAGINESLRRLNEIAEKTAELEAEKTILNGIVKENSKAGMIKLYNRKENFPESLRVVDGNMELLFITMDKYIKIDEDRAKELIKTYNKGIVSENTVFTLNSKLVEKYSETLSDLIMGSEDITENDKADLIEASTSYAIAKGTIQNLKTSAYKKHNVSDIIENIRPIFAIKSIKPVE